MVQYPHNLLQPFVVFLQLNNDSTKLFLWMIISHCPIHWWAAALSTLYHSLLEINFSKWLLDIYVLHSLCLICLLFRYLFSSTNPEILRFPRIFLSAHWLSHSMLSLVHNFDSHQTHTHAHVQTHPPVRIPLLSNTSLLVQLHPAYIHLAFT